MLAKKEPKEEEKQLGITVKKDKDFSEWYTQVIQRAGLIEYTDVSGCMIIRPYAYAMWERFQEWFNARIKAMGVSNAYFPLFIPEKLFMKETKHVEGFSPEVAWVTMGGHTKLPERLAIRPTSETIMYDAYSKWVKSWRDLPLKINQWCNVVRWEFKHPVPFLRTREFLWQEGHTVHATQESADKEAHQILELYAQAYEELFAIPVIKGKKSEKEKFAGANYTLSLETFLPVGKAIQCCTSHSLGQNFAKPFNIQYLDEKGKKQYAWQNSWGFTTRSIGIMTMFHGDDKGLVLPPAIAPIKAVIIPIVFDETKAKVLAAAEKLHKTLQKEMPVHLDDRDGYTPGWKFNEWEMKGVPVRIEIGPKDLEKNQAVLVRRDTGEKKTVAIAEIQKTLPKILQDIQKNLYSKAKKFLESSITEVKDWDGFMNAIQNKKLVKAYWCANEECEDWIKDKSGGAKSINIPFDQPSRITSTCVQCGKPAKVIAYFAKSY
ncbi:MAG: proline--tRNA ligase [Candidatus Woesearchaeota archaeon]